MPSIARLKTWWKKYGEDITLGAGIVLLAAFAFFAGRLSAVLPVGDREPIVIEVPEPVLRAQEKLQEYGLLNLALPDAGSGQLEVGSRGGSIPEAERRGEYVASKYGKYYYAPDAYMAGRIKPENRVWFATRTEAEQKGYKPAK